MHMGKRMRVGLRSRFACLGFALIVTACAGTPEPETPPHVVPTKQKPRREPLPPAPSNTPEVVYARNGLTAERSASNVVTDW